MHVFKDSSNRNFAKSFVYDIALAQSSGTIPSDEDLVVVVDGIGASYPFRVAADVYATALSASLRVFYYQRNGVALDTTWYPWLGLDFPLKPTPSPSTRCTPPHPSEYTMCAPPCLAVMLIGACNPMLCPTHVFREGLRFQRAATFDRAVDGTSVLQKALVTLAETGNADYAPTMDIGWTQLNDTAQMDADDVCDASMGWQDAGDWDTRAPHLEAGSYLMVYGNFDLVSSFDIDSHAFLVSKSLQTRRMACSASGHALCNADPSCNPMLPRDAA